MPIRQRGKAWQVDVRLADGSRFRKTFPTKEHAEEAEKAMTPNPQQRAIARFAVRASRSKSADTARSVKPSSDDAGNSNRNKLPTPTSRSSLAILPKRKR